jgi:hypothetical protein
MSGNTCPAKAMHLETNRPLLAIRVVIMQNLQFSTNLARSCTFSVRGGFSIFAALYGSAGLLPVSVLLVDILGDDWRVIVGLSITLEILIKVYPFIEGNLSTLLYISEDISADVETVRSIKVYVMTALTIPIFHVPMPPRNS